MGGGAGRLVGHLGLQAAGGAFQLRARAGVPWTWRLLLPLQLPLPLMELMESEVLQILTNALRSESLSQLP